MNVVSDISGVFILLLASTSRFLSKWTKLKLLYASCILALLLQLVTLTSSAQYTKLLDFAGAANGSNPQYASLISDGTFLYGMTETGGINGLGTIFKILPDGTGYAKLLDLDGATNGSNPRGSLIYDGTFLYGMTMGGGANDLGTIFKIMPDGNGYETLLDFNGADGSNPFGSLISVGTFLYGMTTGGGANNGGTIFKIMPDGTAYLKLWDFGGSSDGFFPFGSLFSDGAFLYGTTSQGGSAGDGVIFKIQPDGGGYLTLLNFTNEENPRGSLVSDGTFLYGMTFGGGINNVGSIFKIKPDGTGFGTLLDFEGTTNGGSPPGSLISVGAFLYGMAGGGANDFGTIFKIIPDGSGYSKLLDLDGSTNGSDPQGSLISDGTFLYGMTTGGGTNDLGTVFKYSLAPLIPTITNFTPASGSVGTTVTITGTNFSATPAGNIVFFGATQATVTNASSTSLDVIAPTGATYKPISVMVNGLTAFSQKPFVLTFAGGGSIDACSFAPRVQLGPNPGLVRPALGDVDGDGKSDIIVPESSNDLFSIYRNISTVGTITTGSFATKVDFSTANQPFSVAFGDLDGDGKPEVVAMSYTDGNLSVYKNNSTPGTISLASRVDFTIPGFAHDVAISDIDLDGKSDLVITTSLVGLTVLRNTSTTGVINTSSFAAGVTFGTGPNPQEFYLGDIDGDGKPDAAVANNNAYSVSILRNTSVPGTVSFASHVVLSTAAGSPPIGGGPYYTSLGDLDGDGKSDLIVSTHTVNTLSIFRNTSVAGTLSFDAKFDISISGTPYDPELSDLDGDGKIDLTINTTAFISVYKNVSVSGVINGSSFNTAVNFSSPASAIVTIGDIDGDGRNDLVTNAGFISILQNVEGSISSPAVTSFAPSSGVVGTPVTITGTNFTTPFLNTVEFNGTPASITGSTSTTLNVTVPVGATTGPIEVTIGCNTVTSSSNFTLVTSCVPSTERDALVALYTSTNGNSWTNKTNWLNGDEGTWFGVTVTGCNVTGINLNNNNLVGGIPIEIGNLISLSSLQLWSNQLTGTIPDQLGTVTTLVDVNLSQNLLSGSIPPSLGSLSNLQFLALNQNQLSGSIPTSFGSSLSSLRYLDLLSNKLTGTIPNQLGNITTLEGLNLSQNLLSGSIPISLAVPPFLSFLELYGNQLTGAIPSELGNAPSLAFLRLSSNQLSGSIPTSFGSLTDLFLLDLDQNLLSGPIPPELGFCTLLRYLNLNTNQLSGPLPPELGSLTILEDLNLYNNQLSGSLPIEYGSFTNLVRFGISNNNFTGSVPIEYLAWNNIEELNLSINQLDGIPTFTANTITALAVENNNLEFGDLESNIGITGYVYSPQKNLAGGTASICEGTTLTISFSTSGTANSYQWFKEGALISGATSATYSKNNATLSDAGNYTVQITSSLVPGLALQSDNFTVSISIVAKPVIITSNCTATSATLSGPAGLSIYAWSNGANTQQISITSPGSYTLTVTNGSGCVSVPSDATTFTATFCNQPPVITTTPISTTVEGTVTVLLSSLLSDPDGNLDLSTLKIVKQPTSGATASLDASSQLILNYAGRLFSGTDELTIEVCDFSGQCVQQVLAVEVIGDITIYNGISPNGDGLNDTWLILYIDVLTETKENKVFVYNRWGDVVFETENYNNQDRVFKGLNKSGNELSSGTYFYKIEFASGRKTLTGYLAVKK